MSRILNKEYVIQVRELLGDDYENAVLYGSYAIGIFTEESDIDIAIFTERGAKKLIQTVAVILIAKGFL